MKIRRRTLLAGGGVVALGLRGSPGRARTAAALLEQLSAATRAGGGIVEVSGSIGLAETLRVPSNVELRGVGEAYLYPERPLSTLLEIESLAENVLISGIGFDGGGACEYLLRGEGVDTVALEDCTGIGWRYGFVLGSTRDRPARNLRLSRLTLREPAAGAVYPILVRSGTGGPLVQSLTATDILVEGSGGAYSRGNSATGDQVTLQGVRDFRLVRVESSRGGENGLTVSRLSGDGLLLDCVSRDADGQGFSIGSGYLAVDVDDASGLRMSGRFEAEGGAEGEIQEIAGRRLFLNKVVRGSLSPGEEITSRGVRARILGVSRTENIALANCLASGNWRNSADAPGTGAGFLVQQADAVGLYCCTAGNFQGGAQDYGLVAAQSRLGWTGCRFSENLKGDVVLFGRSAELPIAPDSMLWQQAERLDHEGFTCRPPDGGA